MLSKVMMPDAARSYLESQSSQNLSSNNKNVLKEASVEASENNLQAEAVVIEKNNKKLKNANFSNSNWEKFKEIVNQPSTGTKSPPKRPLRSSESPYKGKRRSRDNIERKSITNARPDINLENMTITKQVAMDCEMVGIGDGTESMLARVSIVNRYGVCIYDKYVKPRETVQDYRTFVSGIRPHHIQNGEEFEIVQAEVADILKGRTLVGHALKNDLAVLFLSHPKKLQRDTSRYKLFRRVSMGNTPSLKKLAAELLGVDIQTGEHNSVEDARTAMELYDLYAKRWELDIHSH